MNCWAIRSRICIGIFFLAAKMSRTPNSRSGLWTRLFGMQKVRCLSELEIAELKIRLRRELAALGAETKD